MHNVGGATGVTGWTSPIAAIPPQPAKTSPMDCTARRPERFTCNDPSNGGYNATGHPQGHRTGNSHAGRITMHDRTFRRLLCAVGTCAVVLCGSELFAQFQNSLGGGGTTSRGTFGNRTVGAASGVSARSGSMFGGAGGTVAGATQQAQQVGTVEGSERFLRGNRQGAFVGADTSDTTQIGSFGNALNNFFQGPNMRNARDANQNLNPQQTQTRRPYRTTTRISFDYPAPPDGTLSATLTSRLQRARLGPSQNSVAVEVRGHTATLRGQVATDHERALAEQLVRLEPGIAQVDNQLVVSPSNPPRR